MFDSLLDSISPSWILGQILLLDCIVFPFIIGLTLSQSGVLRLKKPIWPTSVLICAICLFCLFASFDGDYFHYRKIIQQMLSSRSFITHMEFPYVWLVNNLTGTSYILFRLVVWGLGLVIYNLAFKKLGLYLPLIWTAFTMATLVNIAFIRGFLAYSIFFYGFVIVNTSHKNLFSKFLGTSLLLVSVLFHKSMAVLILLSIGCQIPIRKWNLIIYILLIPIAVKILEVILLPFLGFLNREYAATDTSSFGIGYNLFNYISYLFVAILLWKLSPFNKKNKMPILTERLWRLSVLILILFLVFFIFCKRNDVGGMYMPNRIFLFEYCIIPYLFYKQLSKKTEGTTNIILIILCFVASNYRLLYAYYIQSLGAGI